MTTVETALGPLATAALGPTLMHEHIVTRSPGVHENWPHLFPRDAILALAERKMADLYARQGLVSEARRIYESLLQRDPDNDAVREKLAALPDDRKAAKVARLQEWLSKVARREVSHV